MQATANRPTARLVFGAGLALALLAAVLYQRSSERTSARTAPQAATGISPAAVANPHQLAGGIAVQVGEPGGPASASPAAGNERLRLAKDRLDTYRAWAKYPPTSRPARENSDQLYPRQPVVRTTPLSLNGQPSEHIGIKLRQDRMAVVGADSIQLGIRCEDSQNQVLPCAVESAQISALPMDTAPSGGPRPVRFIADPTPEHQGELLATLRPLDLQLVKQTAPLRVDVKLKAGNDPVEEGAALFDFLFTPDPPALPTGKVREALVDGSLVMYYGMDVRRAGRYVLSLRVDDSQGRPFAFLEWNDLLPVGAQEVKLVVFGKLVLDEHPSMPLKLRDLDGFLLKEQADPDRENIPPLTGYHYTTQSYASSVFSASEWQSEERARHEREFEHDVDEASP